jgi:hypothetical protein
VKTGRRRRAHDNWTVDPREVTVQWVGNFDSHSGADSTA